MRGSGSVGLGARPLARRASADTRIVERAGFAVPATPDRPVDDELHQRVDVARARSARAGARPAAPCARSRARGRDSFVTLEIADGVRVKVQKFQVTSLIPKGTIKGA
jgi:hypothetical protein